jgi:tRNA dimethylallyltransferase
MARHKPAVIVVAGPTAAGKTDLAIRLAERCGGELINADSMQVYRHMDIGTAKPTAEQRSRVPHHLLDVVDPDDPYDAGRFASEARVAAETIRGRGRVPILVGGTGFYLRAFLEGLIEGAGRDVELRARLEAEHAEAVQLGDPEFLHRRLRSEDPRAGETIHPSDVRRTIRALELRSITGRPASELRQEHGFRERRYRTLYLVRDPGRDALAERIDRRCAQMIEGGLLQEVRGLRELGYGPELRSMQAIGYRHMEPVIQGRDTLRSVLPALQHDTRQFARRQRTWFRGVRGARWLGSDDEKEAELLVEQFLAPG